jgi:hypothetical protein
MVDALLPLWTVKWALHVSTVKLQLWCVNDETYIQNTESYSECEMRNGMPGMWNHIWTVKWGMSCLECGFIFGMWNEEWHTQHTKLIIWMRNGELHAQNVKSYLECEMRHSTFRTWNHIQNVEWKSHIQNVRQGTAHPEHKIIFGPQNHIWNVKWGTVCVKWRTCTCNMHYMWSIVCLELPMWNVELGTASVYCELALSIWFSEWCIWYVTMNL